MAEAHTNTVEEMQQNVESDDDSGVGTLEPNSSDSSTVTTPVQVEGPEGSGQTFVFPSQQENQMSEAQTSTAEKMQHNVESDDDSGVGTLEPSSRDSRTVTTPVQLGGTEGQGQTFVIPSQRENQTQCDDTVSVDSAFTPMEEDQRAEGNTIPFVAPSTSTPHPQMNTQGFYIHEPPANRTMQIFVRNFNGKVERFEISENASVEDLRKLIHNKMGINPSQQRLVYQSREMVGRDSLTSYGVQNLSEIQLLGRLRGGLEVAAVGEKA